MKLAPVFFFIFFWTVLFTGQLSAQVIKPLTVQPVSSELEDCICPPTVKPLVPENCPAKPGSYGTVLTGFPSTWIIRVELLTKCPAERPAGFIAYQIAWDEIHAGYWVISAGEYSSKADAETELTYILQKYPEFCKAFVTVAPKFEKRLQWINPGSNKSW